MRQLRDLLHRQPGAGPRGEPARHLRSTGSQRRLRTHCVLAEVDDAFALGLEQVAKEGNGDRSGRRSVPPTFDLRPQVEHPSVTALDDCPRLVRIEGAGGRHVPLVADDLDDPAAVAFAIELEEEHPLPGAEAELAVTDRNRLAR